MRGILLSLICAAGIMAASPAMTSAAIAVHPSISATPAAVYALQVPDKKIDINVSTGGSGRWYRSPIWIAIGAIALVVVLLLVVVAARGGGGTTIVKG